MSKRMTSETIIFDTDWLTEADFGSENLVVARIDYQAYDTLKIIVNVPNIVLAAGGLFQEFEVYKIENSKINYQEFLVGGNGALWISSTFNEDKVELAFNTTKHYWKTGVKGLGSIYIKGVKR